ncbi:MAG: Ig domain-containing protein, partial [Acidobacteria bacterium]|nr:Ig domain-containing protein [Acidobacteriota bacterium]
MEVGVPYSYQLQASGGLPPHRFFVYVTSRLPSGLELSTSGEISGRPLTANSSNLFTIIVRDSTFETVGLCDFRVAVVANRFAITTSALPRASVGVSYSSTIQTSGGAAPVRFEFLGGAYPPGLQGFANGLISGTPTAPGNYTMRFRVTDANGNSASGDVSLIVEGPSLRFETSSLPNGEVGLLYSAVFRLAGNPPAASFQLLSGQLPP